MSIFCSEQGRKRVYTQAASPEDKVVTRMIRLDHANRDDLKRLFVPLISKNSVIISYPPLFPSIQKQRSPDA
jgi:hypothetical protein